MSKPNKQRILFVVQELNAGGAAYLCVRWIKRLIDYYEVDLFVVGQAEEKMLAELPKDVSILIINESFLRSTFERLSANLPLGIIPFFWRMRNLKKPYHQKYQAVLATSILASWRACTVFSMTSSTNKILFLVDEALATHKKDSSRKQKIVELSVLISDYVISVSRSLYLSMAKQCEALNNKTVDVMWPIVEIQNNCKTDFILKNSSKKLSVLTVARLTPGKKILESLYLHHALKKIGLEFVWHIVGEGDQHNFLKKEIKRLNMVDSFILEGFHENVEDWMSRCDIFALLSDSEGCPTVVIEALQCNCVVLTTRVNGVEELIVNEQTGLIVDFDWSLIQHQLSRLVIDHELRAKIKNNVKLQPLKLNFESDLQRLMTMIDSPQVNSETCCATAPLVSILIPTYNQANLIDKAISSALMQDFSAFEVIVIDDTSSDGTEAVCQKWLADPRFRYVRNPVNLGRVANYRHALYDLALGDWALMLDGDDYLTDPSFIRSAWETAQRYQDNGIVFVQAGHRVHFLDDSRIDVDILPEIDSDEILLKSGEYLRFVYEKSFFTHLGILFNRSAAIKNACYTANISSSDMVSFLGLSLQGSVVLMNKIAGCWVQHGNNTSANLPVKDIANNVKIFRDIADIAIKNGLISKSYINPALTKYEAQTLAFLFASSICKTTYHPLDVLRLIPMVITINPNLIFNLTLIKASLRCFIKLTIVLVKRLI